MFVYFKRYDVQIRIVFVYFKKYDAFDIQCYQLFSLAYGSSRKKQIKVVENYYVQFQDWESYKRIGYLSYKYTLF